MLTVRARRFGCREIKVPSAPIFSNRVYHVVLLLQLLQRLFLIYSLTTAEFVNSHLYLNMYRCCGLDRRNN